MIDFGEYRSEERREYCYIRNPETLNTATDCQRYDKTAADYIDRLQKEIETMREYRQTLFERMQKIYSATYFYKVTLHRQNYGTIAYFLRVFKVYSDGIQPEEVSCVRYCGKDRSKAIKDFRQYVKDHPGILAEMNIEKSKWER